MLHSLWGQGRQPFECFTHCGAKGASHLNASLTVGPKAPAIWMLHSLWGQGRQPFGCFTHCGAKGASHLNASLTVGPKAPDKWPWTQLVQRAGAGFEPTSVCLPAFCLTARSNRDPGLSKVYHSLESSSHASPAARNYARLSLPTRHSNPVPPAVPRVPAAVPGVPPAVPWVPPDVPGVPPDVPEVPSAFPWVPRAVPWIPPAVPFGLAQRE